MLVGKSLTPVVLLGDSITTAGNQAWFEGANYQASEPFRIVNNAGVSGNRTDQMLARLTPDVIAFSPAWCMVEGGGNDVTNAVSAATIMANLASIYGTLKAAGIKVIASTVLGSTSMDTGAEQTVISTVNTWLRANYLAAGADALCDWNPAWTGGVNEWTPLAGITIDGVHPNTQYGIPILAAALAPTLRSLGLPSWK